MPVSTRDDKTKPEAPRFPDGFLALAIARLVSNAAFRLVFPFLPRVAAGLGVSLTTMGSALAVQELTGLASPAIGRRTDRRSRTTAVVIGMSGLAIGLTVAAGSGGLALFIAALVLVRVAKAVFDIGSSAWVADMVPFAVRGRAFGLIETTWAASFILMPLAALAIRLGTWRTPFLIIAVACATAAVYLSVRLPDPAVARTGRAPVRWSPILRAAIAVFACLGIAHQILLVSFASFLEDEHGLSVAALGLTAVVFGVAELAGSAGVAAIGDTVGKSRGAELALGLAVPITLLMPLAAAHTAVALALFAAWFTLAEFAIVSLIALFSELDATARGTMIGLGMGGFTGGHAMGSLVGAYAYERHGIVAVGITMAASTALGWAIAHRGVFDPDGELGLVGT